MRTILKFLLVLLIPITAMAQNGAVKISPSMFDKTTDQQFLSAEDGWLYRQGDDTAWAKKNIDTTGWKKIKLSELSAKYADKNGRLECWLRIKIKLDTAFGDKVLGIKYADWAAVDLYVDGELLSSFGNTGRNGETFHEFRRSGALAVPVNLKPGGEYTIALHFVDYVAPLPPVRLKSEDLGLISMLRLTGPQYISLHQQRTMETAVYGTIWVSVSAILSFLFWFLFIQNPIEKNLRFIALGTTALMLGLFFYTCYYNASGISYLNTLVYLESANFFLALSITMAPVTIAHIFKRRMAVWVKVSLAVGLAAVVSSDLLPRLLSAVYALIFFGMLFGICSYYIVSSLKKLKGAQWAIVVGLVSSLVFSLLFVCLFNVAGVYSDTLYNLLLSAFALSFPLSLMVYVAIRFREIIKEVQQNAQQVVQLSEEKKQEALHRQKLLQDEVDRQTAEIRSNQARLIQSEKMASLGELTAGIAHEIQNPLNFVNNFSEVNSELLQELKAESKKPKTKRDGQLETELINDLIENEQKINHHGKRADAIVKGMLQHSQNGSGAKELTNINALADEYLRLSYHGLRSKDKSFSAEMITRFDEKLPLMNVIPQDIGRVMLNLFNNAFYAVNQRSKTAGADYKPEVSLTTSTEKGQVIIKVKDNGVGIPNEIKEKIMQPFFTTKPTGEGTGLGLSLTYDMVVKGHGGSIQVNSIEGQGSEFIILLPVN